MLNKLNKLREPKQLKRKVNKAVPGLMNGYKDQLHEFVDIIAVVAVAVAIFLVFRLVLVGGNGDGKAGLVKTITDWIDGFFTEHMDGIGLPQPNKY